MIKPQALHALALCLIASAAFGADRKPMVIGPAGPPQQIQTGDTLQLAPPTASSPSLNFPLGATPTAPADGDCWAVTAGLFCEFNGQAYGLAGTVSGTIAGGSPGELQYNNGGVLGGFNLTGDCTFSEPSVICTKSAGVAFAASATTDATNASNIISGSLAVARLAGGVNASGTTFWRGDGTWAVAGVGSVTSVGTNNGLTGGPVTGAGTIGIAVAGSTAGQVMTSNGASSAPTWQAPGGTPGGSNGQIQYDNGGVFGGFTLSGDCTLSQPAISCTKTAGVAFANSATIDATNAANITSGNLAISRFNAATSASASTFWRGDGTWASAATAPGGSTGQLQYDNAGAFGGFTLTGDCTLSRPAITCNETGGVAFAASATIDATNASNIGTGFLNLSRLNFASSSSGQVITSNGGSSAPTWQAVPTGISLSAANSWAALQTFSDGLDITPAATPDANAGGYLGAPQASGGAINANKTMTMTDAGELQYYSSSSAWTLTIPANATVAYPLGTVILIVNDGSANLSLGITSDTLEWGSTTGSRTLAPTSVATLIKVTATMWRLTGTGVS